MKPLHILLIFIVIFGASKAYAPDAFAQSYYIKKEVKKEEVKKKNPFIRNLFMRKPAKETIYNKKRETKPLKKKRSYSFFRQKKAPDTPRIPTQIISKEALQKLLEKELGSCTKKDQYVLELMKKGFEAYDYVANQEINSPPQEDGTDTPSQAEQIFSAVIERDNMEKYIESNRRCVDIDEVFKNLNK